MRPASVALPAGGGRRAGRGALYRPRGAGRPGATGEARFPAVGPRTPMTPLGTVQAGKLAVPRATRPGRVSSSGIRSREDPPRVPGARLTRRLRRSPPARQRPEAKVARPSREMAPRRTAESRGRASRAHSPSRGGWLALRRAFGARRGGRRGAGDAQPPKP